MAASEETIVCTVCGAKNEPQHSRCQSCGAKLDPIGARELSAEEEFARRHQQDTFEWKWVAISAVVYGLMAAVALIALPMVIDAYEPQGFKALLIAAGIWFIGGALIALVSPGKTFLEPTVGALVAVVPTLAWIHQISDIEPLSMLGSVVGGALGVMLTLMGGFMGEWIQMRIKGTN